MPIAPTNIDWQSPDTVSLARSLIGHTLALRTPNGDVRRRRIIETEAYDGAEDLACHASKGRTARTEVMFSPGGVWYVYLCYGIHEMLNLVTGPKDYPAAILIRAIDGAIGPGRLTKALGINRRFNGLLANLETGLWIESPDSESRINPNDILASPRIGVAFAGPVWSQKPWRFSLKSHPQSKTRAHS